MEVIRRVVHQYQVQSPAHFELEFAVYQIAVHSNNRYPSKAIIDILLEGCAVQGRLNLPARCRVTLRGHRSICTIINRDGSQEALENFLSSRSPTIDAPLRQDTLWRWWLSNGKNFNWTALPTELKEQTIEHCMHQPHSHGIYNEKLTNFNWRYKNDHKIRKPGPYEIVDQLSDWYQLLYVSHQVRAITLHLCITGGSSIHSKGLCIVASSYRSFCERINRLSEYYQMVGSNSIPTTSSEEALSKCYGRFPRIYPRLKQYATLRDGIQKISLGMDFLSFMHFFKVEAGGFQRFPKPRGFHMTYEIFERLPDLNEIVIRLPLRPRGGWKDMPQAGDPQLFHEDSPCPRRLHRVIYERVAEVLASYDRVTIQNFVDGEEKQRFESARLEAINVLSFTRGELEELYADDGGGVELPDGLERGPGMAIAGHEKPGVRYPEDLQDEFFPPLCFCDAPCILSPILDASEHHW